MCFFFLRDDDLSDIFLAFFLGPPDCIYLVVLGVMRYASLECFIQLVYNSCSGLVDEERY